MEPARIGIRELREGLSAALRKVRSGQTLEVTDRGRAVARIVPVRPSSPLLERMIAQGKLHPATEPGPLPKPLQLRSRMTSEEAIRRLRGD